MAAQIPNTHSVQQTVTAIESGRALTEVELHASLNVPGINTGLDHWHLWTLICLCRHLSRQKWVGYVVETRLKGDLAKVGTAGSLGHPDGIPQEGEVPDEPGWRYFFHGRGCCLTNKEDGASIDVDFTDEGASDRIDRFFYSNFLQDVKRPEFPERLLQRKAPLQHAWQANIDALSLAGCLEVKRGIRITQLGREMAEALEPILDWIAELTRAESVSARQRLLYAALNLGDLILSEQVAERAEIGKGLTAAIARAAEQAKERRATRLIESLQAKPPVADGCQLAALADLGINYAKPLATQCVFRTPVDGVANTALAILVDWNELDVVKCLEELIERRYAQAFGFRSLAGVLFGGESTKDKQPREYQIVRAVIGLLQRSRPGSLKSKLRDRILSLLEATSGANSGEAALLLYAFDNNRGLNRLRLSLSGEMPAAHSDSAAACVLLGTRDVQQILLEALDNPDLQIQHTAACALKRFPSAEARESAARWYARLDGIDSPQGKEVSIDGQTITAYTFDDVSHANQDMLFSSALDRLRKDFALILS